jgi:Ser/Thr protein kinase RdoA (MazF antagonist)
VRLKNKLDPAYANLGPDEILNALNSLNYRDNGEILALNSYENRVYRLGLEDDSNIVIKFYRPERWCDLAIMEEHQFAQELVKLDIPIIEPVKINNKTLHHYKSFRFSLWECFGGRAPDLDNDETLKQLGRLVARIHLHSEFSKFEYRPTLDIQSYGYQSTKFLLDNSFIPPDIDRAYTSIISDLFENIKKCFKTCGGYKAFKIHGDLHPSNILTQNEMIKIVDLDDARNGPSIQDLWMFLSGSREDQEKQMTLLLEGYEEFRTFDYRELHLIEALRSLRMLHYTAWIAKRWDDPAFKIAFPWFGTPRFWDDHILSLREQLSLTQEPPLNILL